MNQQIDNELGGYTTEADIEAMADLQKIKPLMHAMKTPVAELARLKNENINLKNINKALLDQSEFWLKTLTLLTQNMPIEVIQSHYYQEWVKDLKQALQTKGGE